MHVAFDSRTKQIAVLSAAFLLCWAYLGFATVEFVAARLSGRTDLASLQRAAELQPWDAEYEYHLGRYFLLLNQPADAADHLGRAVHLDTYSADYWLDLAAAYNLLDRPHERGDAIRQGAAADPKSPVIAWEAANLYVTRGDIDHALKEFRVVLESDPSRFIAALQQCQRITDLNTILHEVMPPNPQAYYTLLDMLMVQKQTAGTKGVWAQLAKLRQPLERAQVFSYVQYLIGQHEVDQARLVWQQASNLANLSAYQPTGENLVINSDFSLDVLNGGFDWLYQKSSEVTLALDPTQSHSGHHSLSIAFSGGAVEDFGIRQLVPVEPSTAYEFSAYFKAENIEGAGGPRFAIHDAYTGTIMLATDDLKDADFWKPVNGRFVTAPDTKLIVIRVQRVPAGRPIRGKLWIDAVRLIAKANHVH